MIRLALLKVPAIGAATAALVGVTGGGMMRPDASQFERPAQTLIADGPIQTYGALSTWSGSGPPPSYVVGTDSLRPVAYAQPYGEQTAYLDEDLLKPTMVDRRPDSRPSKDDRADSIKDAQATSPQITAPAPARPTSFPSVDGDTLGGLTQTSGTLTRTNPGAIRSPRPLTTLDSLLGQIAGDDARATNRIAGRQ